MKILECIDLAAAKSLLAEFNLVHEDLNAEMLNNFIGILDDKTLIGLIGVEYHHPFALLRSLAVKNTHRNKQIGHKLVEELENKLKSESIQSIYLLTNTAEKFFSRLDYRVVERDLVPDEIRATKEFSQLCPASATVMLKDLIN